MKLLGHIVSGDGRKLEVFEDKDDTILSIQGWYNEALVRLTQEELLVAINLMTSPVIRKRCRFQERVKFDESSGVRG